MFALGALHVVAAAVLLDADLALRTLSNTTTTASNHAINAVDIF